MSHRTKVKGTRSATLWLLVFIAVVLVVGIGVGALFLLPQLKERQALEKHYQAGVAFGNAGDWEAARSEYIQVISLGASYTDVQARLVKVKANAQATATAEAVDVFVDGSVVEQNASLFPGVIGGLGHSGRMSVRIHSHPR